MHYTYSHHAETCTLYSVVSEYYTRALLNTAHICSIHAALHKLTKKTPHSVFNQLWCKVFQEETKAGLCKKGQNPYGQKLAHE